MDKFLDKLSWIFVATIGFGCFYAILATWLIFTVGASGVVAFPVSLMYFCTMWYVVDRLWSHTP